MIQKTQGSATATLPFGSLLLLVTLLSKAHAFSQQPYTTSSSLAVSTRTFTVSLSVATDSDQDTFASDDFYADYDPSQYEDVYDNGDGFYEQHRHQHNQQRSSFRRNDRRGGYNNNGNHHDYTRDTSRDSSNVDEAAIDQLISERLQCRRRRDFDRADEIRDVLLNNHGVRIHDKTQTWRSGCSASGSGARWNGGGGNNRRDNYNNNRRDNNNRRGGGRQRPPVDRDFGPLGHDYAPSPDAGPIESPLEEAQIHQLLAQRLQYKLNRDFRNADALQQELLDNGILVHDGMKQWRADGQGFFDNTVASNGKLQSNRPIPQQSAYSDTVTTEDELQDITALLEQRAKLRQSRLYDQADDIKETLAHLYQIKIDDRRNEWSRGGDFGPRQQADRHLEPYRQAHNSQSTALTEDEQQKVQQLVERRDAARAARDFAAADKIRTALETKDIVIDDKLRQWSVGGEFDYENNNNSFDRNGGDRNDRREPREFTRRGGGSSALTDEQIEEVQSLLKERQAFQKQRNYDAADDLRSTLRNEYNVQVDDRNREWHVISEDYVPSASTAASIPQERLEEIQQIVNDRLEAKNAKDYDKADALRDGLMDNYNVKIDDRVREWSIAVEDSMEENDWEDDEDAENETATMSEEIEGSAGNNNVGEEEDDDEEEDIDETLMEAIQQTTEDNNIEMEEEQQQGGDEILPALDEEMLLAKLTVPELKDRLRASNLRVSGRKSELIERLLSGSNE